MIDQFDREGRCCLWNRECVKRLGYTYEEIQACSDPLSLFYPDATERDRVLDAIRRADGTFREYRVRAKDGSTRIQLWADFRLPNGAQISVGHDVTAQRETEAMLRQSQKMEALGQLTGGMAHDFNNLLALILANAQVIERASPGSSETTVAVSEIISGVNRGAEMIRKLLAFSRHQPLLLASTDARALVDDLMRSLARLLPDTIDLTLDAAPALPRIDVDPGAVEQVLLNLITNARDAVNQRGRLSVALKRRNIDAAAAGRLEIEPGDFVTIEVTDDGVGMDQATLTRIFEPFFTTKEAHGTGLGMPMVYGLMKQQRGAVEVESEPGHGTTVRLLFPSSSRAVVPEVSPADDPLMPPPLRVLLVENEPAVRRATEAMLRICGHKVHTTSNGKEGLAALEQHGPFDVVLCDVIMPKMSGTELYEASRALTHPPPFVLVTGHAPTSLRDAVRGDDAVRLLEKPYELDTLLEILATVVRDAISGDEQDGAEK